MHTIAHYMSVALRANDTLLAQQDDVNNATRLPVDYVAPSHRVSGTVYVQTTLLRVCWKFLLFPAVLVLLAAVLLFETIRTSRPDAVGVWKVNALAILLNTQWSPAPGMMGARTGKELDDVAEALEARVVQGEGLMGARRSVAIRKREVSVE